MMDVVKTVLWKGIEPVNTVKYRIYQSILFLIKRVNLPDKNI